MLKKFVNIKYNDNIAFGIIFFIVGLISWRWVVGIDYMKKNHPDYKGDDFLNWGEDHEDDKNQIT